MTADTTGWGALLDEFEACHQKGLNATLHMVTTPLGLLGLLSLVAAAHPGIALVTAGLYAASLFGRVPTRLWFASTAIVLGLAAAAIALPLPWTWAVALIVAGYALQELAHVVTGERTFQSTYQAQSGAVQRLAVHTWMLLPLVIAAFARHLGVIRALLPRVRVVHGRIGSAERHADIERVRGWVAEENPTPEHTTHWWFHDPPRDVQVALQRIAHDQEVLELFREAHPGYEVEVVHEMNEVYVAGPEKERTSDTVFYTPHVDGPFAVWPFATVYRSLVGVTENTRVRTEFVHPTEGNEPLAYTLTTGDFLAFDFNRELHFIRNLPERHDPDQRCVLKVHYVVYPKGWGAYGRLLARLTGFYDQRARELFLSTLAPATPWEKLKASVVLSTTRLFDGVTRYVGWGNLVYVAALGIVSAAMQSMLPLLIGASFVHYLLYLGVFQFRSNISFGQFKRDAMFFKGVAYAQLIGLLLYTFTLTPPTEGLALSLGLMIVGYGIATAATMALGVDRTWFGVELGQLPPKRIEQFPYGVLPHPMIVGGVLGLLGFHLYEPFRELVPWLVPAHITFYLVHLLQEATDDAPTANRPTDRSSDQPQTA